MISKTKSYLFVAFFLLLVVSYLFMTNLPQCYEFIRSLDIFPHGHDNFIFIIIAFATSAYILTELIVAAMQVFRKKGWSRPKIGKILISQGFINQDQLQEASQEQKFKIGEVLVQDGRITPEQRDQAMQHQRKKYRRIGVILRELSYSTEEDIRWALNQMNRRLGKILRQKRLITDYDLNCALTLKKLRSDGHGRA